MATILIQNKATFEFSLPEPRMSSYILRRCCFCYHQIHMTKTSSEWWVMIIRKKKSSRFMIIYDSLNKRIIIEALVLKHLCYKTKNTKTKVIQVKFSFFGPLLFVFFLHLKSRTKQAEAGFGQIAAHLLMLIYLKNKC